MATLSIPDALYEKLRQTAAAAGEDEELFAADLLATQLEDLYCGEIKVTDELVTRFKRSIEELNRGEGMRPEEVDAFFDECFRELDAR